MPSHLQLSTGVLPPLWSLSWPPRVVVYSKWVPPLYPVCHFNYKTHHTVRCFFAYTFVSLIRLRAPREQNYGFFIFASPTSSTVSRIYIETLHRLDNLSKIEWAELNLIVCNISSSFSNVTTMGESLKEQSLGSSVGSELWNALHRDARGGTGSRPEPMEPGVPPWRTAPASTMDNNHSGFSAENPAFLETSQSWANQDRCHQMDPRTARPSGPTMVDLLSTLLAESQSGRRGLVPTECLMSGEVTKVFCYPH